MRISFRLFAPALLAVAALSACMTSPPDLNHFPVANAGPDRSVSAGSAVVLDGSGSSDPDGDPLGFAWTQVSGPVVTLAGANAAAASFTAPTVTNTTTLTFRLTVSDGLGATRSVQVRIQINPVTANPPPVVTVSGVAATGAAISGGSVALRCGHGFSTGTTSASNGAWTVSVPGDDLPCAVKLSGGIVNGVANAATFYAFALAGSGAATTANLTPISDLVIADAVGAALDSWFNSATDAQLRQVANGIAGAISTIRTALIVAGYTLPENFNPLSTALTAGSAADLYDQLLEAYKQALATAGTSYADARNAYAAGGELPTATTAGGDEVSGPLAAPAAANAASFLSGLVGNYRLRVVSASGAAAAEFEVGKAYAVQFEADGTLSVSSATRTISHIYVQHTLSDYDSGATEILRFYGNGFCCDFYLTYTPAEGYLTIEAAVGEGLVKLESNKGTPPVTEPETPVTPAGAGLLGDYLKTVLAGDYTLKCSESPGQAVTSFAFTVKPDGSSTLDGVPLVDAAHPGQIKVGDAMASSSAMTVRFAPAAANSAYVVLGFKHDGAFYPNSIRTAGATGKTLFCYSNTGHSAPAASAQAFTALDDVVAALARSEALDCTQAGATTARSFGINSDGSAQVGSESFATAALNTIVDDYLFGTSNSGRLEFSDVTISGGTVSLRSLQIALKAGRATAQVLLGTGLGPNDVSDCHP